MKDRKSLASFKRRACEIFSLGTQGVVIQFSNTYNSIKIRRNALLFWLLQKCSLCLWTNNDDMDTTQDCSEKIWFLYYLLLNLHVIESDICFL